MRMRQISKAILAAGTFFLSYTTSCSDVNKKANPVPSYIQTKQFNANTPIQDRIHVGGLSSVNGIVVSVFDGHGGDLCAQYLAANIQGALEARVKINVKTSSDTQTVVKKSLQECYDDLENGFKAIFLKNMHDIEYQRVGSCALTAVITPSVVVVANAGDCEGAFLGGHQTVKTNQRLNAGESSEQDRLRRQFPGQADIFKCIPNTNYCYVKGRLQPTRSFGDFYLKDREYNFTSLGVFTGPYITHRPVVTRFDLTKQLGKTLVLATDGLWDELDQKQMRDALQPHHRTIKTAEVLLDAALKRILSRNRIASLEKLKQAPNRRNLHDDISIVTVDLQAFLQDYDLSFLRGF